MTTCQICGAPLHEHRDMSVIYAECKTRSCDLLDATRALSEFPLSAADVAMWARMNAGIRARHAQREKAMV